jgi:hypothetical protein
MENTTVRTPTIHKKEIIINRDKLSAVLERRGMGHKELWTKIHEKYGLDISYKGFMSLIWNKNTWKLLYAHAISDVLLVDYRDIFEVVDIDVDKKKKEKEEWKAKYQKKKS